MVKNIRLANIFAYNSHVGHVTCSQIFKEDFLKSIFGEELEGEKTILDCGCGNGALLLSLGCNKVGLDISLTNIKEAKSFMHGGYFAVGDAEYLPFKDNSFEGVILNMILHHLSDYKNCIKSVKRVLKAGGKAYLFEGNSLGLIPVKPLLILRDLWLKLNGRYPTHELYAGRLSLLKIKKLFLDSGFDIYRLFGGEIFVAELRRALEHRRLFLFLVPVLNQIEYRLNKVMPIIFRTYYGLVAIKK